MMRETVKSFPTIQESKTKVEPKLPTPMGFVTLARVGIMTMRINQAMSGMLNRYEKFWTSITPLREPPANGKLDPKYDDTADPDDTASLKQRFECWRWDSDTCQHVEMDLIERLTRIGARPFILLKEDYQTTGWKRLFPGVCLPWEDMCNMLRSETILPDTFWEFGNPTRQPQIMDLLREGIRQKTLPAPLGSVPQEELPPYDSNSQQERNQDPELNLEDIGPSLSIPPGIDLTPPKPPPL
jgi:hypothetical protein